MWRCLKNYSLNVFGTAYRESKDLVNQTPPPGLGLIGQVMWRNEQGWRRGTWEYGCYRVHPPSNHGFATWTFEDIPEGHYEISVSYISHENRSNEVLYEVIDMDVIAGRTTINQTGVNGAIHWESLGAFHLMFGDITVKVFTNDKGFVVANSVKLEEKRKY